MHVHLESKKVTTKIVHRTPRYRRCHQSWTPVFLQRGKRVREMKDQCRIVLNVSGDRFETYESTLSRFPNTLLGSKTSRLEYYNKERAEYVFDRDKTAFDAILFYYQSSGILSRPSTISDDDFRKELQFFRILPTSIQYKLNLPSNKCQRKLWLLFEYPETSTLGKVIANISFFVILVSSITFCIETSHGVNTLHEISHDKNVKDRLDIWFVLETLFVSWFTLEYLARLIGAPKKSEFLFSLLGLIDITAIIPYYATLALSTKTSKIRSFSIIRAFRLVQVLRIMKLTRHSSGLQILGRALLYCKEQMGSLLFFFLINALVAASLMYWFESDHNPEGFESIPASMWYCIISMTTVGYGDVVPVTVKGKVAGSVCIMLGTVILFHLFIPVYLTYFSLFYEVDRKGSRKK